MKKRLFFIIILIVIAGLSTFYVLNKRNDDQRKSDDQETLTANEADTEAITDNNYDRTEAKDFSVPAYSGTPYCVLNENDPKFSEEEKSSTEPFESYSELDSLGRCGVAYANICKELMPDEERGLIGQVKPSGWHTVKYSDLIDGNYLYNRCHLIAYSLTGENANEKNLITGTRYLNVEGMQYFETIVLEYVERTGNHVLYRVTPIFEKDNLVASGVEMEAWSVEDAGQGVCFHVYCYNVQPGITIDYATGDSRLTDEEPGTTIDAPNPEEPGTTTDAPNPEEPGTTTDAPNSEATETVIDLGTETRDNQSGDRSFSEDDFENEEREFILNTNSRKIHLPECDSVNDMKEKNRKQVRDTLSNLKNSGYIPCARCLGDMR